jgi:hypothetical protein
MSIGKGRDNDKPERKNHDWHNARFDNCGCGYWARLVDGMCADCHEADYRAQVEAWYLEKLDRSEGRIAEAVRECEGIIKKYVAETDDVTTTGASVAASLILNRFPEYFRDEFYNVQLGVPYTVGKER